MLGTAASRTDLLTALGALATAIFTLGLLVLSIIVYRHTRDLSGRRKPVVMAKTRDGQFMYLVRTKSKPAYVPKDTESEYRLGYVHIFNHSDSDQFLAINDRKTRIVWPRMKHCRFAAISQGVFLPPHSGGSVPIVFRSSTGRWPDDKLVGDHFRRNYWGIVKASTTGLRKVRYGGRVWLIPYNRMVVPRPADS